MKKKISVLFTFIFEVMVLFVSPLVWWMVSEVIKIGHGDACFSFHATGKWLHII